LKDANDGAMMPYTNCVLLHSTDSVFAYGVTSDDKGAFCFKGRMELEEKASQSRVMKQH
jgi:hypothetical protein